MSGKNLGLAAAGLLALLAAVTVAFWPRVEEKASPPVVRRENLPLPAAAMEPESAAAPLSALAPAAPPPAPARPALRVRVVDGEGRAIENASVRLVWCDRAGGERGGHDFRHRLVLEDKNESGEFVAPERLGDTAVLVAAAPLFAPQNKKIDDFPKSGLAGAVVMILEPAPVITGRLVDAARGNVPISGALVSSLANKTDPILSVPKPGACSTISAT
ncbi:MAG: hypothetical protein HY717_00670 [Planctomycetes bacterium]|nr:hypothetical protein [Planctomycetota bacterium]